MFINDKYPVSVLPPGTPLPERERTRIGRGASIGSNATILGNMTIGANAIVGAGSVVTHDVPENADRRRQPGQGAAASRRSKLMDF